jgi:hypothetical protein
MVLAKWDPVRYRNAPVPECSGTGMRCRNADSGDIGLDADAQMTTYAFKKEELG